MGQLVFVGLGLNDEDGISLQGLEEAKTSDSLFVELYTSFMPDLSLKRLEQICGKRPQVLSRKDIEDKSGKRLLKAAREGKAVFLVPGDPLVATTHVSLRIEGEKHGIQTRIVHGASILSAVIGLSGLHNYKFGKTVTIPFPGENPSDTPNQVITQNMKLGLHTLCLLDIKIEDRHYLNIRDALGSLLRMEAKKKRQTITARTLAVGIARAGSKAPTVKAASAARLMDYDFGNPPYSLIFPGKLHFMEAEALIRFGGAPAKLRDDAR